MIPLRLVPVMGFLNEIGISATIGTPSPDSFLPGVEIQEGGLVISADAPISNILHEAGHLAILPAKYREFANGHLGSVEEMISQDMKNMEPDSPEYRAAVQCSDPEATAWAFAAGRHLGIPDEQIIEASQYDGEGAEILQALQMSCWCGIHGLQFAGFCSASARQFQRRPARAPLPVFPKLAYWTQA